MNKSELIDKVAVKMNTKKDARDAVQAVFSAMTEALGDGEEVRIIGFGTFKTVKRKARRGVNPQTGKTMKIKAKTVAKFVPGKNLKETVG